MYYITFLIIWFSSKLSILSRSIVISPHLGHSYVNISKFLLQQKKLEKIGFPIRGLGDIFFTAFKSILLNVQTQPISSLGDVDRALLS